MPSATPALSMDLDDVSALLEAGVGEEIILQQMETEDAVFRLSTEDILDLKDAGASDRLIKEMLDRSDTDRSGEDWTRDYYDYGGLRMAYDPFAYNWYASPFYFTYYYPFRYWDLGFYYAGWYSTSWWGWGPCCSPSSWSYSRPRSRSPRRPSCIC